MAAELESEITCPHCGHRACETMPADQCLWYWECPGCGVLLRPKSPDCCVFCSYGTRVCPPKQVERAASTGEDEG